MSSSADLAQATQGLKAVRAVTDKIARDPYPSLAAAMDEVVDEVVEALEVAQRRLDLVERAVADYRATPRGQQRYATANKLATAVERALASGA